MRRDPELKPLYVNLGLISLALAVSSIALMFAPIHWRIGQTITLPLSAIAWLFGMIASRKLPKRLCLPAICGMVIGGALLILDLGIRFTQR